MKSTKTPGERFCTTITRRSLVVALALAASCAPSRRRDAEPETDGAPASEAGALGDAAPDAPALMDAPSSPEASVEASVEASLDAPAPDVQPPPDAPAMTEVATLPEVGPEASVEPCPTAGLRRCDGRCVDLASDMSHCGACSAACIAGANQTAECIAGECDRACARGFANCDGLIANGCEASLDSATHCGACGRACAAGQICASGTCASVETAPPPQQFAPLSGVRLTRRRPEFVWRPVGGAPGTQVQVCRTRACAEVVATIESTSARATAPSMLEPGVYYWRARTGSAGRYSTRWSPVWQFRVPVRDNAVIGSWGVEPDFNGDGYADIAAGAALRAMEVGAAYVWYGGAMGPAEAPSWDAQGRDGINSRFGVAVAPIGDFNGDGFVDLAVGASLAGFGAGRVYIYLGGASGLATTAAYAIAAPEGLSRMGETITAVGDINGDGYADFATGAPTLSSTIGAVYVYTGRPMGALTSATQVLRLVPDIPEIRLGRGLSVAGDVNGDGFTDLIAGAPGDTPIRSGAYLFNGGPTGFGERPSLSLRGGGTDAMPALGEGYGRCVSGVGDVNGDGYYDVLIGAVGGNNTAGFARLHLGSASGLTPTPAWMRTGAPFSALGEWVSGGADVNADGFDEMIVVTPGAGQLRLYYGSASGPVGDGVALTGSDGAENLSPARAATIGDVNGDGFADVLVGSPYAEGMRGRVHLFYGAREGVATRPAWTATGPEAGATLGWSVGRW